MCVCIYIYIYIYIYIGNIIYHIFVLLLSYILCNSIMNGSRVHENILHRANRNKKALGCFFPEKILTVPVKVERLLYLCRKLAH